MTTTTFRKLRANLKSYFDSIDENKDILVVPRSGDKDAIVIMSLSEYNSIVETDYLLSTEANRNFLKKSLSQLEEGEVVGFQVQK